MEFHQITQSLVSLGLTLLTVGMLSPTDPLPGDFHSEPWSSFLPRLQPQCHRMAYWKVPVWHYLVSTGPKRVHRKNGHCGLVPGPSGPASPAPSFMTQMERGPAEDSVMFGLQGCVEPTRCMERCRRPFSQDEAKGNTGLSPLSCSM